eukprot:2423823-Alexandrium_andersonii.AAC.1
MARVISLWGQVQQIRGEGTRVVGVSIFAPWHVHDVALRALARHEEIAGVRVSGPLGFRIEPFCK